ncbi:MAG: M23 family metallopeptidase [Alphaproteobacteria bacterium]|nr:M23 family metallopeptidase [Alphaproteobacteria bacterium]
MFKCSKLFSAVTLKKSISLLVPTIFVFGLSACSSDVVRFASLDMQNRQVAFNNVQQTNLAPLVNTASSNQVAGVMPRAIDSQFTATIPSSNLVQTAATSNNGFMGNNNPDTYRISTGDTLYSIARRFGLTVETLSQANNLDQYSSLKIGQQIFLPRKGSTNFIANSPRTLVNSQPAEISSLPQTSIAQQKFAAPVATKAFAPLLQEPVQQKIVQPAVVVSSVAGEYIVQPKDTLYSIARAQGVHVNVIKNLNGLTGAEGLRIGQKIRVNGAAVAVAATPTVAPAKIKTPVAKKAVVAALPKPEKRSSSRFRWPVSGRVISEYGKKPDGRRNDGLNVAVPPGTVVKASENGVVAYAGNGLKSYGNLILVKHDGGWVTAYAHNGSILVKKGDKVRRGQAIARSGQTGDVTKPQLHFEIRRGALAVNPRKYLSSN